MLLFTLLLSLLTLCFLPNGASARGLAGGRGHHSQRHALSRAIDTDEDVPHLHSLSKRHRTLPMLSPPFPNMFQMQLPIPPLKQPRLKVRVVNPPVTGGPFQPARLNGTVFPQSNTSSPNEAFRILNLDAPDANLVLDINNLESIIDLNGTESDMNQTLTKLNSLLRRYRSLTREIWYYEIEIKQFNQSIYPNLGNTTMVGYDGISPGPTIILPKGTESIVRFVNNSPRKNSVHLHGSFSRAPFDGFAEDTTEPGQYKDYYFPNQQNGRTIWYHDHAVHITAENAYMGQAGMYIIQDPAEDALNLPSGYGVYDIPLVLTAKRYNGDGSLYSTIGEKISFWGDVIHVNGQPWPVFNVEPRKYRFRLLNAAVSRSFSLYLVNLGEENIPIRFQVIGSDTGLLEKPVWTPHLYLSMAERYEIILDFTNLPPNTTLELRNFRKAGGAGVEEEYAHTDQIMRFQVTPSKPTSPPDTSTIPPHLRTIPYPDPTTRPGFPGRQNKTIHHHFKFHRANGTWLINGVGFSDPNNRVLAKVPRGTVQIWELENTTDGWSHPIHVHLVDFRVLHRSGTHRFDSAPRSVQNYERFGLKDVVWLGKEEKVWVEARYAPWDGVYMFHCHNLVHEDDDMMASFNVTGLINMGLGYRDQDFIDPMEPRWRAKGYNMGDFVNRLGVFSDVGISLKVWEMALRDPYLFGRLGSLPGGGH